MSTPGPTAPLLLLALLLGASCAAPVSRVASPQAEPSLAKKFQQIDVGIGIHSFADNDWKPNDDLTAFAFYYQERERLGPFALEGGVHYAYDDGNENGQNLDTDLFEFTAGLWYDFGFESTWVIPFVGFGMSLMWADVELFDGTDYVSDDDSVFGGYGKVGLLFPVGESGHLGFEVRRIEAGNIDIGSESLDASATEALILFGARF